MPQHKHRHTGVRRAIKREIDRLGIDARPEDVIAALARLGMEVFVGQVERVRIQILRDQCRTAQAANREECDRELAAGRTLVLYFSGNGANRRYRAPEFGVLTSLGVDVFKFDYRGYGDNSGSPSEEMLAADARAIWKYATRERNVQPDRIILYGESLGGAVAVRLAAELCEADSAPAGVILRSTFSSLVDAGSHHYPWLPVRLALVDRFSSMDHIPQVTCPILQIHGARDSIMPQSESI